MPRIDDIRLRRGILAEWTAANPVLNPGEVGLITDQKTFVVGDGVTVFAGLLPWASNDFIAGAGSSFPAAPATNQLFLRTDLGWLCRYDGTRWLTLFELSIPVPSVTFAGSTSFAIGSFRTDYAPYVTRIRTSIFIGATNDASNYWDLVWRGVNATYTGATSLLTESTSGDGASAWVSKENVPTTAIPGARHIVDFAISTIGSPSSIGVVGTLFYKLIVT